MYLNRTFNVGKPLNAAGDLLVSVPVTNGDTTARAIAKDGYGRLVFQGDNAFTGVADINSGELRLDYSLKNGSKLHDNAAVNLRGGDLFLSGNASAATAETIGQ